jgi:hypothetical protein
MVAQNKSTIVWTMKAWCLFVTLDFTWVEKQKQLFPQKCGNAKSRDTHSLIRATLKIVFFISFVEFNSGLDD